jgi:hypothetical protein
MSGDFEIKIDQLGDDLTPALIAALIEKIALR